MLERDALALTTSPVLNTLIWVVLLLVAGYLARRPAHGLIRLVFSGLRRFLRLLARYCVHAEHHVRAWTRSVLVAQARQHARLSADWNVERLGGELDAELNSLSPLEQRLQEQLSLLEEDYRSSSAMPPDVPGWPQLVDHLGPDLGAADPTIKRTLEDLRDGLEMQRIDLLDAYRRASRRRYLVLHRTMPQWRRARRALEEMTRSIERLRGRSDEVLQSVRDYETLRDNDQVRIEVLAGNALWRFALSAGFLVMAGLGFLVLGQLLATPFTGLLGTAPVADGLPGLGVAVTALILVAPIVLGLCMLESCRMTYLLPGIVNLDEGIRRWLFWLSYALMVMLTVSCVAVVFTHGGIAPVALDTPFGGTLAPVVKSALVLLLPFALMFAALPLAGVIRHGRVVAGLGMALLLQIMMLLCRLLASLAAFVSSVLVQVYDLFIFLPLWIEETIRQRDWRDRGGLLTLRRQLPSPTADDTESARQTGS